MNMKSAIARGGAGLDGIEVREALVPEPRSGEALVRLNAATLNFRDLLFAKGLLGDAMTKQPEYVPLSCAAGEVVAVGAGVDRVAVGDRVSPTFIQDVVRGDQITGDEMLGGTADGVARQFGAFPAGALCRIPDELGDLEAAALPCAGLTAWSALFGPRPIQADEWVLLQGTGGVSVAALQWAKAAGAKVAIISSSDRKLARARALGADVTVNYCTTADWAGAVRLALGGAYVDIAVDVVGTGQLQAAASLLSRDGVVAAVGMLNGTFSWGQEIGKSIFPIAVGSRDQHEAMLAFAAKSAVRPVVDLVYDLDRLQDAFRRQENGEFFGKIGVNLS